MKKSKKIIQICIAFGLSIVLLIGCVRNSNVSVSSGSVTDAPLSVNEQITQLIEKGKYEDAKSLFPSQMNSDLKELFYINNAFLCDKDFNASCVASFLIDIKDYNGTLKAQVDTLMSKYQRDMIEITNERSSKGASNNQEPFIGMTKDDLLNYSRWGKPNDINKTITKYGTSEQWVYNNRGYIYLEDGKVTAIQTN
jgi:hypothetical protein